MALTVCELLHAYPSRPPTVRETGDEYIFDAGGCAYRIPRDRCRTPREVLSWLRHLSEKTWFRPEHVADFLDLLGYRE